ncbi:MAG: FAD-dependent oxidoreductase, partial [Terriglobia bacterium]
LTPLLPERWLSRYAYFQQFTELTTTDQTIVQAVADRPLTTPRLMLLSHQPDYSALTIIGDQKRTLFSLATTNSQTRLAQPASNIEAELADLLRSLRLLSSDTHLKAIQCHTIPNAILPLKPGTKMLRPIQRSPIANLFVAGAWTDTGWPCNLESAIESGNRCARAIQGQQEP